MRNRRGEIGELPTLYSRMDLEREKRNIKRAKIQYGWREMRLRMGQTTTARKITVTNETLLQAAHCNQTWRELCDAIQTHLRIEIRPIVRVEGDESWRAA